MSLMPDEVDTSLQSLKHKIKRHKLQLERGSQAKIGRLQSFRVIIFSYTLSNLGCRMNLNSTDRLVNLSSQVIEGRIAP